MRLLAVDDHPLMLEILRAVVKDAFPEHVFETAGSLSEAIKKATAQPPDLTLLDLGLPDSTGLATLTLFREALITGRVVVISAIDDHETVVQAMELGAAGFFPKSLPTPIIGAALRLIAAGGTYLPPQAMIKGPDMSDPKVDFGLTERQLDVLRLIVKGLANKEIAQKLRIAEDTVKQHARATYAALGVSSRMQAMHAVVRRRLAID